MKIVTDGDSLPMLELQCINALPRLFRVQEHIDGEWRQVDEDTLRCFAVALYPPRLSGHDLVPY